MSGRSPLRFSSSYSANACSSCSWRGVLPGVWQARRAMLKARVSMGTPSERASSKAASDRSYCPASLHAVIMPHTLSVVSTSPRPWLCSCRISHHTMPACSSCPAALHASSRLPQRRAVGAKPVADIWRHTLSTRSKSFE